MNLNQITTRIGELSAELLTLHNDLAFLTTGVVERPQTAPTGATVSWRDLKEGDLVHLQESIVAHGGRRMSPGIYKVAMVEEHDYTGVLPFAIADVGDADDSVWVYFNAVNTEDRDNGSTNTYNKFRKV